jgi:hypothetical protein
MMRRYKVRFHLGAGKNYMKWQVFDLKQNHKDYYDPENFCLLMRGCELGNHPSTAKKIHEGANKTVCAWVSCDQVMAMTNPPKLSELTQYKYNPRKNPHWFTDTQSNVDGRRFKTLVTHKRNIYG